MTTLMKNIIEKVITFAAAKKAAGLGNGDVPPYVKMTALLPNGWEAVCDSDFAVTTVLFSKKGQRAASIWRLEKGSTTFHLVCKDEGAWVPTSVFRNLTKVFGWMEASPKLSFADLKDGEAKGELLPAREFIPGEKSNFSSAAASGKKYHSPKRPEDGAPHCVQVRPYVHWRTGEMVYPSPRRLPRRRKKTDDHNS